ncbi:hypothetical protein LJK88_46930 [Paenibacillus sp. P26]|nr:hypothetical protein LJK88_46930 [Paenibacillus sp. P26]
MKRRGPRALSIIERTAKAGPAAFYSLGRYYGNPGEGYTHAYCVSLPDLAALDRYFREPVHREGDFQFIPLLAKLSQMTISDDPDPEIIRKVMACRNAAVDPEWMALFDRFGS